MVTTNRLVSLDAVGRAPNDLIHLTGPLQVVARAAVGDPAGAPVQVDFHLDAERVRGVGLKTGTRYWAQGIHHSRLQLGASCPPVEVEGSFELLGLALENPQPTRLTLRVRFRVTVPAHGRVTVEASEVKLLPAASPPA